MGPFIWISVKQNTNTLQLSHEGEREKKRLILHRTTQNLYTQKCHQKAWHLDFRCSSLTNLRGFHTHSHLSYLYIYKERWKGVKRLAGANSLSPSLSHSYLKFFRCKPSQLTLEHNDSDPLNTFLISLIHVWVKIMWKFCVKVWNIAVNSAGSRQLLTELKRYQ